MTGRADQHTRKWRKSSYSNGDNGSCVEVATVQPSAVPVVPVRDSKDLTRGHLTVPSHAWAEFTNTIRL